MVIEGSPILQHSDPSFMKISQNSNVKSGYLFTIVLSLAMGGGGGCGTKAICCFQLMPYKAYFSFDECHTQPTLF
jgi:hypothetical protein